MRWPGFLVETVPSPTTVQVRHVSPHHRLGRGAIEGYRWFSQLRPSAKGAVSGQGRGLLFLKAHTGQRLVATISFYHALEPLATVGKSQAIAAHYPRPTRDKGPYRP